MNYYRRYMADYLSKTASLTLVEHGAYTLLLDYLYLSNGMLPGDEDEICRMVRAVKPSERQAVVKVLDRFFVKAERGYTNPRAEEEIELAKPAIEAARTNGVKGGRPKKNPVGLESEPTAKASHISTTNHQPLNHQPLEGSAEPASADSAPPAEVLLPTNNGQEFPILKAKVSEWEVTYPGVDVPQTLREIRQWLKDNPSRRKTAKGMHAFVNRWLMKEQNGGRYG